MGRLRPAQKVPVKVVSFSERTLVFFKKWFFLYPLLLIPLAYFFPTFAFVLFLIGIAFYLTISPYFPEPLFEKEKKEALKNGKGLPFLYVGKDELGYPVEIPVTILKQHLFLMGSTGSGKTSLLRRMLHTHFYAGGGCCFIDGKADVADMYQVFYGIVAECDRLHDFYVLNFLNPEESHTFNPFVYGDAVFLSEILAGLLKPASGDQVYWQERGLELMRALMSVLVWLRDNKGLKLTFSTIRKHLNFASLVELAKDEGIPLRDQGNFPVRERLIAYLQGLSDNWYKYPEEMTDDLTEALRQFAYGVQQWSATLDVFYAAFGKVLDAENPDVDVKDVVLNNKILYVLLPALKQSQQTLASLGRFLVSTFKIVFSELIGQRILGDAEELNSSISAIKPDPPFLLVLDEAGSYIPEDVDNVLAQARSTGVGVIISVQEIASLRKGGDVLEKRVLNNTKLKICLAVDDPEAADYFVKRVGRDWTIVPQLRREVGDFVDQIGNIDGGLHYDLRERLEPLNLYSLEPGYGYVIYLDELRKFYSPYLKPKKVKEMVLYKLVPVVSDEFNDLIKKHYKPFAVNGYKVNVWDEVDLEVLKRYDKIFQFSHFYKESASNAVAQERFTTFISMLVSQMLADKEFLKMSEPTLEVWDEIKKFIFDVKSVRN